MNQQSLFDKDSRSARDTPDHDIRAVLRERLLSLPYSAFAQTAGTLLDRMGYADVAFTSRKDFRGRNGRDGTTGGYDIAATLQASGVTRRILVQAKQFGTGQTVYQRSVDELRGACLRTGAAEGILLTTGSVSSRLPRALLASAPFAPVRLVDGEELLDLLLTHRVGVWAEGEGDGTRFGLDDAFFASLLRENGGNGPGDSFGTRELLVTVSVERKPGSRGKPLPISRKTCHTVRI